jgi:hypothetical protein
VNFYEHLTAHAGLQRLHRQDGRNIDDFHRRHRRAAGARRRTGRGAGLRLVERISGAAATPRSHEPHCGDRRGVAKQACVARTGRAGQSLDQPRGGRQTEADVARPAGERVLIQRRAPIPALAQRPLAIDVIEGQDRVHAAVRLRAVHGVVRDDDKRALLGVVNGADLRLVPAHDANGGIAVDEDEIAWLRLNRFAQLRRYRRGGEGERQQGNPDAGHDDLSFELS